MADGVGLGKTLEVGVLLAELIRRGRGDRILVVALKSILAQFQEELWARFTIPLVRLDSRGIERVRTKIPSNMNPFYYFDRVIISIDTLKRDQKYRRFLEQAEWDVVVVDECQNVAVRARGRSGKRSQRARLADLLARRTDALVLTSATPHDGRPESFASLVNLLEPTAIADPSHYEPSDIRGLYVRRFKKDIAWEAGDAFHERNPELLRVDAGAEEDAAFALLRKIEFRTIDRARKGKGILFRTTLLKAFLSSPDACASTISERLKRKALSNEADPAVQHDRRVLGELKRAVEKVTPKRFGKLQRVLALLRALGYSGGGKTGERIVIFSERIDTLKLLRKEIMAKLGLSKTQVPVFHGTLDDVKQQRRVKEFGTETGTSRILLASDAASEGINLHFFCHWLVHFDVPWSLITLEQRNGRIDRFGQTQQPEIRYLLTVPDDAAARGDLRVLDRLVEKEKAAHDNLGDVAWLMGLYDPQAEEERIAASVEGEAAPEEVVPDDPEDDDWLSKFGMDEDAAGVTDPPPKMAEPLTLYPDDLTYHQDAFAELQAQGTLDGEAVEWLPEARGLALFPPDDLLRRFQYLPPELRRDGAAMNLTVDRDRVQEALADSRQERGRWPDWQLLWDLHPVAEWLGDRVLGLFTRHEAPVLEVPRGIRAGEAALLFQGVLSNQRSQPVIVEWFGVLFGARGSHDVFPFEEFVDLTGLDGDLSNRGAQLAQERLPELIGPAVEAGARHMRRRRVERDAELSEGLREEERRVRRWFNAAREVIDAEEQRILNSGRKPRSDEARRFEQRRSELQDRIDRRKRWIQEGLKTVDAPYLRLAAVLVGPEVD